MLTARAAKIIESGGLVILATETYYGIATDPFNERSLRKVFRIKKREDSKPLPLIASGISVLEGIVSVDDYKVMEFAKNFWPGSLTVLLRPRVAVSGLLTGSAGKIAVRIPPYCRALELARMAGGIITSTSANVSGLPAARTVDEISPELIDQVDMVMDSGPAPGGSASTILEVQDGKPTILRHGAVPEKTVMDLFQKVHR